MTDDTPHARAFELPGWPCPPRVADIPEHKDSYGWIYAASVAVDDEGLLWVDGLEHPQPQPSEQKALVVLVAWCENGIATHIPRPFYSSLHRDLTSPPRTRTGEPYWVKVARVLQEPPPHATGV